MQLVIKNAEGKIEKVLQVDEKSTLLKQLEANGVEIHSACHAGICGACICTIEAWENLINKSKITEPWFPLADNEVMTCIWGCKSGDWEIILKKIY